MPPPKRILALADIEDGLNYNAFRKRYKELIPNITQKDISSGYKLYKDRQRDDPIVIIVPELDIQKAKSVYKSHNNSRNNETNMFKWSYYTSTDKKNRTPELKDFDTEKSNRIETCYRNVLKNGGEICKHMNIDFLNMRWNKSDTEIIDVVRRRKNTDIRTIVVPSYREIKSSPKIINKKLNTRSTPKKKCCS